MSELENGEAHSSVGRLQQVPMLLRDRAGGCWLAHRESLVEQIVSHSISEGKTGWLEFQPFLHLTGRLELPWNTGLACKILILEDLQFKACRDSTAKPR